MSDESPIIFTDSCCTKVADLIAEENNPDLKLRVFVNGGGCSGFQYGFTFDEIKNDDDFEIQKNGLTFLVDPMSYQYLVGAEIDYSGDKILIKANAEERALAVLDVFQSKLVKRGISLKSLDSGKPYASGKETRIECSIKEGIAQDQAKKISKISRTPICAGSKVTRTTSAWPVVPLHTCS